jgi:hypothetical protein
MLFTKPSKSNKSDPQKQPQSLSKNLEMILEMWQNAKLNGSFGEGSKTGNRTPVLFRQRGEIYWAYGWRGPGIGMRPVPQRE